MKKYGRFLRIFIVILAGLLLGSLMLLVTDRKPVPARAQAQELFTLYFEMDTIRQESAQIFAELLLVAKEPERVGAEEAIGAKPPLSSRADLSRRLNENQVSIEQTLNTIEENRFTDSEVSSRYEDVQTFYATLFEFEEMVLTELSLAESNEERHAHLATTLFEGTAWPALLSEDAHLRETLASLAGLHGLEFVPSAYDELFRERLAVLDTPLISGDVNTVVYPFTVNAIGAGYVSLNITFDIPLSDKISVSLEDPSGRIISTDQLAEYTDTDNSAELNNVSYIYRSESVIIIKLFPEDAVVKPIPGDWKMYVTAPVGSSMVIGMIQL